MLASRAASLRHAAVTTVNMAVGPSTRRLSTAVGASSGAEVVVVGSNIIDMTAYTPRLPARGETILGTEFQTGFGGKGANQCVQAAKLGVKTAMVTKVGTDSFGTDTIENFQKLGVDTTHVLTTSEASSGVAPILVDADGHNCIVVVAGANMLLTPEEVQSASDTISGAKVLITQMEVPRDTTLEALRIARASGVTTVFNPAPGVPDLEDEFFTVRTTRGAPLSLLTKRAFASQLADIFCPNETETELITGLPVSTDEEVTVAARELLRKGPANVLLTLGDKGALLVNNDSTIHIPGRQVDATDTSGAGDSFVGSLCAFLAMGCQMPDAMRRAGYVAGESVQGRGTQSSFKSRDDLPAQLFEFDA